MDLLVDYANERLTTRAHTAEKDVFKLFNMCRGALYVKFHCCLRSNLWRRALQWPLIILWFLERKETHDVNCHAKNSAVRL